MRTVSVIQIVLLLGTGYCFVEESLEKKCHAFSGEDANVNLQEAIRVFKSCFMSNVENFRHRVANTKCKETTLQIQECDNNILKKVTECKSPDEEHFPKSIFTIVSDYTNHICSKALSYKISILLDHEVCFPSLFKGLGCLENFRFFNTSAVISKEEMCSDYKDVQECLLDYANSTCPNDPIFPQLIIDKFNFNEPPCTGSATILLISKVILFIFALFTLSNIV